MRKKSEEMLDKQYVGLIYKNVTEIIHLKRGRTPAGFTTDAHVTTEAPN